MVLESLEKPKSEVNILKGTIRLMKKNFDYNFINEILREGLSDSGQKKELVNDFTFLTQEDKDYLTKYLPYKYKKLKPIIKEITKDIPEFNTV